MNFITKCAKNTITFTKNHAAEILSFLAGLTVPVTIYEFIKGDRQAQKMWNEKERAEADGVVEYLKETWKNYLPGTFSAALTIALIWGSNRVSAAKLSAIASLYSLSESSLREFKEKAQEVIGEKKMTTIKDRLAEDAIRQNPPRTSDIYQTHRGNQLCYDSLTDRYFYSSTDAIRRARNDANQAMLGDMFLSMNGWYEFLGLDPIADAVGEELGWNSDYFIEISFSSQLIYNNPFIPDETPCLVICYDNVPTDSYRRYL